MAETFATERVEAVIISGPRRGEIITLDAAAASELSEAELERLNSALKELDAAFVGLKREMRGLKEDLRSANERSEHAERVGGAAADRFFDAARQ